MDSSAGKTQHELNLAATKAEEAALRRYEATEWLESLAGPLGISNQPSEREFISCLRSGLVLCNAINKILPGSVQKVIENQLPSKSPTSDSQPLPAFQYFENVKNFLVAAEELKLTTFEAPVLETDNFEAGSSAKVVDCILELKALHDWKQMNGGNGFNKPPRFPFITHSVGKIHLQGLEETSLDPHSRSKMTASSKKETPAESETQNLEELIVATLAQCMVVEKDNIDANLLASIHSRNPDAVKFLCKTMLCCLKEQEQKMLTEVKPTLNDLLREEWDSIVNLRTTSVKESSSILGTKKCCGACLNKGYCDHQKLFEMQENEVSKLKSLLSTIKAEFEDWQSQLQTDMKLLESQVQEMSTTALGYDKAVKENIILQNKVQVLKGGRENTLKIVDVSSEEAELQKELKSLKRALSKKEVQGSEVNVIKENQSPSDKPESSTGTSSCARRLSSDTFGIDRREKGPKFLRSASAVITPASRRLSIENHSIHKVEKSPSAQRLSTGTSSMGKLGKTQELKGKKENVYEKAEAVGERSLHHSRRLSSESCGIGKTAKASYLEDKKMLKTPWVQTRTRRLSLDGQGYVNKDLVNSQRSGLPQAATSASKPRVFTHRGDSRLEVSRQIALKSPLNPVLDSQVLRRDKGRKNPSLQPPKTPKAVSARSQLIEPFESQTASMKATSNGKKSQIRKSLQAIGKFINGFERRNTQKRRETTFDAPNMHDVKLPGARDERMLRRQSLAGTWPPVTSSIPSFGVISSGNGSSRSLTPPPVRASNKSPRRRL